MVKIYNCSSCREALTYSSLFVKEFRVKCEKCGHNEKIFGHDRFSEIERSNIPNDINDVPRVFGAYVFEGSGDSIFIVREWYKHRPIFNFYVLSLFLYWPILIGTYLLSTSKNAISFFHHLFLVELIFYFLLIYLELLNRFNTTRILISGDEVYIKRGPLPFVYRSSNLLKVNGVKKLESEKYYKPLSPTNGHDLILVDKTENRHRLFKRINNERQINQIIKLYNEKVGAQ